MNRSSVIAPFALFAFFAAQSALAQDTPEDVKRELKALRGEIQSLRLALSELAELDRQRAGVIARVLEATAVRMASADEQNGRKSEASKTSPESKREEAEVTKVSANISRSRPTPAAVAGGTVSGKVSVPSGEPVAYVYVENVAGAAVKNETVVIEQSKKQFSPRWAVIQRGTTVKFPNLDNIYHNVFSRSPGNAFDLGLYNSSDGPKSHTFYEPGPVDVYCNIHPRMSTSVLVVPSRHFVKVKADGTFELNDVPAGKRKLVAWAPGSNSASEWVELGAGERSEVNLKLEAKSGAHKNKDGRAYGSYE
jgi:plastocyanin